jgi:hypothetical protein
VTGAVAPVTGAVAPVTEAVAPVTEGVAPVTGAVAPVTGAVAPVTDPVATVTGVVAPVTGVVAPVSELIGMGPDVTSITSGAAPLTQPPSDLSLLLGIAGVAPAADGMGDPDGGGLGAAAGASIGSLVPLVPPITGIPAVPLAGDATESGTLFPTAFDITTVLDRMSLPPEMAPLEPDGDSPMGLHSFFRDMYAKLLLPVSLWALFTVALPGVAGLVVLTAIGMRVGYRQAKAVFVVQVADVIGLARSGWFGVVPSEGLSAEGVRHEVA